MGRGKDEGLVLEQGKVEEVGQLCRVKVNRDIAVQLGTQGTLQRTFVTLCRPILQQILEANPVSLEMTKWSI